MLCSTWVSLYPNLVWLAIYVTRFPDCVTDLRAFRFLNIFMEHILVYINRVNYKLPPLFCHVILLHHWHFKNIFVHPFLAILYYFLLLSIFPLKLLLIDMKWQLYPPVECSLIRNNYCLPPLVYYIILLTPWNLKYIIFYFFALLYFYFFYQNNY